MESEAGSRGDVRGERVVLPNNDGVLLDDQDEHDAFHDEPLGTDEEERPVCSVSVASIDYVMCAPTPLEPLEFERHQKQQQQGRAPAGGGAPCDLQVPVFRIFGPIVRRDAVARHPSPLVLEPHQSACVHVHGAFPYLLARPVVAGPDGSIHGRSHLCDGGGWPPGKARRKARERSGTGTLSDSEEEEDDDDSMDRRYTDWDSVEAVRRLVPLLQHDLETTVQSSLSGGGWSSADPKPHPPPAPAKPVIRRITVVLGRGFYTYCPGPVAPFLRVEYYDPGHRHRIKAALNRGLSQVPLRCHPDPRQYQSGSLDLRRWRRGRGSGGDDNEGGDDGSDGPLQFHCYEAHISYSMQFFKDHNLAGASYLHLSRAKFRDLPSTLIRKWAGQDLPDPSLVFLDSNTPPEMRWDPAGGGHEPSPVSNAVVNAPSSPMRGAVEPPPRSTVNGASRDGAPASFNVLSPPKLKSESARLAAALSSTATPAAPDPRLRSSPFSAKLTSCDVELDVAADDILNVRHVMREIRDEDRMHVHWRAVPSLREIWTEERRRMAKLLSPRDDFLSRRISDPSLTLSAKKDAALPGARLAREGMQQLVQVSDGLESELRRAMTDVALRYRDEVRGIDEVLRERDGAGTGVHGRSDGGDRAPAASPTDSDFLRDLEVLPNLDFASRGPPPSQRSLESSVQMSQLSQSSRRSLTSDRFLACSQAYYSRGGQSSQKSREDDEIEFSQRVDRGEPVVDGPFRRVEDFIDPKTLRPFDLLDDDEEYHAVECDGESKLDDNTDALELLERKLSKYATQTLEYGEESSESPLEVEVGPSTLPSHAKKGFNLSYDDSSSDESCSDDDATRRTHDGDNSSAGESEEQKLVKDVATRQWKHEADVLIQLRRHPPARGEMTGPDAGALLPMQPSRPQPPWLKLICAYEKTRPSRSSHSWFPQVGPKGIDVRLNRPAPTRKSVASWSSREAKRRSADFPDTSVKRQKPTSSVRVDENSRKLVVDEIIEDAEWRLSQSTISQTQQSQADAGPSEAIIAESKGEILIGTQDTGLHSSQTLSKTPTSTSCIDSPSVPLRGLGNQGGRLFVEGGGKLKAKTRPSQGPLSSCGFNVLTQNGAPRSPYLAAPITLMAIEIHVQCRTGGTETRRIAMTPSSDRDKVSAVVYIFGRDPGGGESLQILERGCIFVPTERELLASNTHTLGEVVRRGLPSEMMGYSSPTSVECVHDEHRLLLRLGSIVRRKDPDFLFSWDTQTSGLGYVVERGAALGMAAASSGQNQRSRATGLDMVRLLGRTPTCSSLQTDLTGGFASGQKGGTEDESNDNSPWKGSRLGADWDDLVGAGSAAASIIGRMVLAAWKLVAEEVKHPNASFLPAVASSVLGKRVPFHDNLKLTEWYGHDSGRERWRVIHHQFVRAAACLRLFDALDMIGRAGEAARLSGVELLHSFPGVRGSQYKVEGVLLRALQSLNSEDRGSKQGRKQQSSFSGGGVSSLSSESKSQTQSPWKVRRRALASKLDSEESSQQPIDRGYFFYSPSNHDTDNQEALEVQALTLEPESGHHQDPVVVCDFTALYPSLIIAYNLCYSTVFGHLDYHSTRREMLQSGRTTGRVGPFLYPEGRTSTILNLHMKSLLRDGADRAYASPNGTLYVTESVLKGVLPQVLDEMLSTRAMLKKAAKLYTKLVPDLPPSILRQLEARQLALKYVANVTYGYTSATFSGRCAMPLLADTIVETGRRTLTRAIRLANEWGNQRGGKWHRARVIYGDTDSVFVALPGRSVREAFQFGEEFCAAVTASNPPPIQLKLEKVYLGSIMRTKKNYCGMKFESKDQKKPIFEAKGIETVRRDQCALTQKILRNSLVTLFQRGPKAVKAFLFRQWSLIMAGKLPVSDFVLTGKVRSHYRNDKPGPVPAALAKRLRDADPGFVVLHKARIAYVIVAAPGSSNKRERKVPLRECVMTPIELLESWDAFTINTAYYIHSHVNSALQRLLGLQPHNINVEEWFDLCPKPRCRIHFWPFRKSNQVHKITAYFFSDRCGLCGRKSSSKWGVKAAVCSDCRRNRVHSVDEAQRRLHALEVDAQSLARQCSACNLCFEDASTFAEERPAAKRDRGDRGSGGVVLPLANCTSLDCPVTYERHRVREELIQAVALCEALDGV